MAYTTIDDPSAYFHTQLYTGNGASSHSITNDANAGDFSPDWLWVKNRTTGGGTGPQIVFDTTRGNTKDLHTHNTETEHTNSNVLLSFDTNGFSVGTSGAVNNNTDNFVAWQWIANGGTTSSNTDGDITSTVQASTTAGFSIVTYTGNGTSSQTVGHGLGAVPDMLIVKNRTGSGWKWDVWHSSFGNTDILRLDQTTARESSNGDFDALPSSSVFTVGTNGSTNENSASIIAYCFTEKQGYSKFGSYTGNANADGSFVYTGFSPAFVITKRTDAVSGWWMADNKRETFNPFDYGLLANDSGAELTLSKPIDFLSNGFKSRADTGYHNAAGNYIYMAFAEHPFVSSEGVPTTAR